MRKVYFILLFFCLPFLVEAQLYGNEWINYAQKYYKIKVAKDGIYRIDSLTLRKAGINLSGLDPRRFQVFYKGKEQYIYVQGENDGVFNRKDYIEFYAQHNDGTLDSLVYWQIHILPNPYYSMFNDTSTYYLTWNTSLSNHRMSVSKDTTYSSHSPARGFTAMTVNYGSQQYYEGQRYQVPPLATTDPHYTQAEGWFNTELDLGNAQTYTLNVSNVDTGSSTPAVFWTVFCGESDAGIAPDHRIQIYANWYHNGGTAITDTSFGNNFPVFKMVYPVAANKLTRTPVTVTYKSVSINGVIFNSTAVSYIAGTYPHNSNMGGDSNGMIYLQNPTGTIYLKLTNFGVPISTSDSVRFYDLTNHRRCVVSVSGTTVKVLVPPSNAGNMQCYITTETQITKASKVLACGNSGAFTNYGPTTRSKAPYIIISHPSLWTEASNYATYRTTHGNYDVVLADVEQLYDQFGYGVEKDALALRRFCNYAVTHWWTPPAELFLIGKGIHTPLYRQDTSAYRQCLVPSYGYPSSDILMTAGFTNANSITPAIPTGRLAAVNGTQVTNYNTKVLQYELTQPALWKKKVIHFCGGSDYTQMMLLQSGLNQYAAHVRDWYFGGYVYNFQKTTSAPIQLTVADSVKNLINTGVSVMTFFGHASGQNFDESIDMPSDYSNTGGKYPLIIANSCFSGDIFQPAGAAHSSTSEEWVLDPKGSIGFIASDDLGISGNLVNYTDPLYTNFCRNMYRKPIADCMQKGIATSILIENDPYQQITSTEMTLHGDPAIAINVGDSMPDYAVSDSSIFFLPNNVTTQIDSFRVGVVVSNLGEAINQPVQLTLTRYYPAGGNVTYSKTFTNIYYQDTAYFTLPVDKVNGVGMNTFSASVDPSNLLRELTKTNNNISGIKLWITSGDIIPVYPYEFAIIPNDSVTLKASTGDPNAPLRRYIFEIDTTDNFNSPFLKTQIVYSKGGVVCASAGNWINTPFVSPHSNNYGNNWNSNNNMLMQRRTVSTNNGDQYNAPQNNNRVGAKQAGTQSAPAANMQIQGGAHKVSNGMKTMGIKGSALQANPNPQRLLSSWLTFTDSTVYYWRVRFDSGAHQYLESSFQYIKGKTGWGQSHIYQFKKNKYTFMQINPARRNWTFQPTGKTLECDDFGVPPALIYNYTTELFETQYKLDLTLQGSAGCQGNPAIHVAVIDKNSLTSWVPDNYDFGEANSHIHSLNINFGCNSTGKPFIFWQDSLSELNGLKTMLNTVPSGDYILAFSWLEAGFSQWANQSVRRVFDSLNPNVATRIATCGNSKDTVPWIWFVQKGNPSSGYQWLGSWSRDSMVFQRTLINNEYYGSMLTPLIGPAQHWDSLSWGQHSKTAQDSVRINVIGVDWSGNSKTLMAGVSPAVANFYIKSINPSLYPYLQLMLFTKDTMSRTPSQMRKWQVFFQPVPEVAVNPAFYSKLTGDSLNAGQIMSYSTVVQNISPYPMPSMQYNAWYTDANNSINMVNSGHPLFTKALNPGDTTLITIKTQVFNTTKSLWLEVNPEFISTTRPEEYHFNNFARSYVYVKGDKINPLLDVTFDGLHIMNNDIVSAHPNIVMQVMDENKYLALNDTNDFAVFLRNTNTQTSQRVFFGTGPNQIIFDSARVSALPKNQCKLIYHPELADGTYELTVQATDRSHNNSGGPNSYVIDFQVITKPMISNVLNYPNPFSTSTRFVFTLTGTEVPAYLKIQVMTITGKVIKEIDQSELGPLHIGRNITQYAWDGTDQFGDKLANGIYLYRVLTSLDGQALDLYNTSADKYFTKGWGKMYLIR